MTTTTSEVQGVTAVRRLKVGFPESDLSDLRRRLRSTRWPERTVADNSAGVRLALVRDLARYWVTEHNWTTCEARLNATDRCGGRPNNERRGRHP